MVQAEEDEGEAEAQSQRLGHGAAVRGQEVEEQQEGPQQGTFRHKGGGGRLAECEEKQLIRIDPEVAEKDQKTQKSQESRVSGGQEEQGGQGGRASRPIQLNGCFMGKSPF